MLKVKGGDRAAFRSLVETYQHPLTNFIYRTVLNRADADELTQDVFLRVYRAAGRYRPEAKFSTWLYRIATNTCLNHLASTRRARAMSLEDVGQFSKTGRLLQASPQNGPHARFERHELRKAVQLALRQLPSRQRMAVTLRRFEGLSYQDIAEAMECSVEAVDSLLRRAAALLREALAPHRRR